MGFGLNGIGRNGYWPNWELDQMALDEMALDEMGLDEVAIEPKANAVLHVQSPQCIVYCPWRYYRPTISCEPGTVRPYQLTPGKSLSQKMKKKKKKTLGNKNCV